ncbi:MAG: GNAT family N-acetyltransferase, partial [Cytophagales bacterium CG18_big_fil_WC_8_21_14_2_50_42_9]
MEAQVVHDEENQEFTIDLNGDQAELAYAQPQDDILDFQHTFVPEDYRGEGLADKLIKTGLEYAQDNGYKVIPSCPAVAAYMRRHKEYESLMKSFM